MAGYKNDIWRLTMLLEGFVYPVPVAMLVYLVAISMKIESMFLPFMVAIAVPTVITLIAGYQFRSHRLGAVLKNLEQENLTEGNLTEAKVRLLSYPLEDFILVFTRSVVGIPMVPLILYLFDRLTTDTLVVSFVGIMTIGPLVSVFFYFLDEIFITRYLQKPAVASVSIDLSRVRRLSIFSKSILTMGALVTCGLCVMGSLMYLISSGRISYDSLPRHILIISPFFIASLGLAAHMFAKALKHSVHAASNSISLMSDGVLKKNGVAMSTADELGEMCGKLSQFQNVLYGTISQVRDSAKIVNSTADITATSSNNLSRSSTDQASTVEEVSSAVVEISATVRQNASNSQLSEQIAESLSKNARSSQKVIEDTVNAVEEISKKINFIEDIANQTNMLSLNAAIEAARVGEAGKGFAVVAAEVRRLAKRSREMAFSIGQLSEGTLKLTAETGQRMAELIPEIMRSTELVREVSVSSREQANGVEQISVAMNQIDTSAQSSAQTAELLATESTRLAREMGQLTEVVSFFKLQ